MILLENYVLDSIGVLPTDKQNGIRQIVQRVYGGDHNWQQTLRTVLGLEDGIDDGIRQLWVKDQEIASQAGTTLAPEEFARMVVDANFASYVDAVE